MKPPIDEKKVIPQELKDKIEEIGEKIGEENIEESEVLFEIPSDLSGIQIEDIYDNERVPDEPKTHYIRRR